MDPLVSQFLQVFIFIGGPILPLLILAVEVGRWHERNQDPPEFQPDQES